MITEEEAAKHAWLPSEQRFYMVERALRMRLDQARQEADPDGNVFFDVNDYMIEVSAAAEAFGIDELANWEIPDPNDQYAFAVCRRFLAAATKVSQKLMYKYAGRDQDPNTVLLSAEAKRSAREALGEVRVIVEESSLPSWRKQDLYDAIAELEREIDKERTRLAAVLDVLGKAVGGDVPVADALRRIFMIVQDAKERAKQRAQLLPEMAPKQLPASETKALPNVPLRKPPLKPKRVGFDKKIDDEIPF